MACVAGEVVSLPGTPGAARSWAPGSLGDRLAAGLEAAACAADGAASMALAYAAPAPCAAAAAALVARLEPGAGRPRPSDSLDLEAALALHPFLASHRGVRARYVVVTPGRASYQAARWAVGQVVAGRERACLVVEAVWSERGAIDVAAVAIGRPGVVAGEPVLLEPGPDWRLGDLRSPCLPRREGSEWGRR
jgi:hypothetical protein